MEDLYTSLYEHVSCGVARARDGVVAFANAAAAPYASRGVGHSFDSPLLDDMSRAASRGLVGLPHRFQIDAPRQVDAVLSAAPWHDREILVVFSPPARPFDDEKPLAEFIACIAADLDRAAHGADTLNRPLQKLRDLATLLRRSKTPVVGDERILLGPLLERAVHDASNLALARQVAIRSRLPGGTSPAVYGSQTWLFKAVAEYLEHVIPSAPAGATVEVSLAAVGTRALVRSRIANATPLVAGQLARVSTALALSRRIVEQYGGEVRIEDEFGAVDVVLELPIGAPASEDTLLPVEQAARFERSVSQLQAYSLSRPAIPR